MTNSTIKFKNGIWGENVKERELRRIQLHRRNVTQYDQIWIKDNNLYNFFFIYLVTQFFQLKKCIQFQADKETKELLIYNKNMNVFQSKTMSDIYIYT